MNVPVPHANEIFAGPGLPSDRAADCEIYHLTRRLIDGSHPGVLTTVDEGGCPHSRWMATLSFDDFPDIYTLTSPTSAKISQVAANPQVGWMFSDDDRSVVVNLLGRAEIVTDTCEIKRAWRIIQDKSHAYFLDHFAEGPGFAVLRTTIERIDCAVPSENRIWSMDVEAFLGAEREVAASPEGRFESGQREALSHH